MKRNIQNIGWTLGNDCPCNCKHCYSFDVRRKGADLSREIADRVIDQILKLDVKTVNIGGNEPVFTSGLDAKKSLLPYILERLHSSGIDVGITTSGISLVIMKELFPESLNLLNDVDISFDSPYEDEHNNNRGSDIYKYAIEALEICNDRGIQSGIIMCAMNWNFTEDRLESLVKIAQRYNSTVRINLLKPVETRHSSLLPSFEQVVKGYEFLFNCCDIVDLSEPTLARIAGNSAVSGCSCGTNSLRINSISPEGKIMVSPCVYMHDFRVGDLLTEDILDIINSEEFAAFDFRKNNYKKIEGCADCENAPICRGGCFAMAYTYEKLKKGTSSLLARDPYCTKAITNAFCDFSFSTSPINLVHQNYLCTCILKPRQ